MFGCAVYEPPPAAETTDASGSGGNHPSPEPSGIVTQPSVDGSTQQMVEAAAEPEDGGSSFDVTVGPISDARSGPDVTDPTVPDVRDAGCLAASDAGGATVEVAHFAFDEGQGQSAFDTSGYCHLARLQGGASWTSGKLGASALALDRASNGFADVAESFIDSTKGYSVTAWAKLNVLDHNQTIISLDGPVLSAFFLQFKDTKFAFVGAASATGGTLTIAWAIDVPQPAVWYHLAGVFDGASLSLYINGVLQSTQPYATPWQGTGHLVVGRAKYSSSLIDFVTGTIDDVHIYRGALTAPQVMALASQ